MLNKDECMAIHERNNYKRAWLEPLCANDHRLVLRNEEEILTCWHLSEVDKEEQAQAARLCAGLNQSSLPTSSYQDA